MQKNHQKCPLGFIATEVKVLETIPHSLHHQKRLQYGRDVFIVPVSSMAHYSQIKGSRDDLLVLQVQKSGHISLTDCPHKSHCKKHFGQDAICP